MTAQHLQVLKQGLAKTGASKSLSKTTAQPYKPYKLEKSFDFTTEELTKVFQVKQNGVLQGWVRSLQRALYDSWSQIWRSCGV